MYSVVFAKLVLFLVASHANFNFAVEPPHMTCGVVCSYMQNPVCELGKFYLVTARHALLGSGRWVGDVTWSRKLALSHLHILIMRYEKLGIFIIS